MEFIFYFLFYIAYRIPSQGRSLKRAACPSRCRMQIRSMAHCLEPPMDCRTVFLMGSLMAATTEILMEHRTEFYLECSTGRHWDQMLDLPIASAMEALMAHGLEPPMDHHSVYCIGSLMAETTAILLVSLMEHRTVRLTQFHRECATGRRLDPMLDLPMASATEA